MSKVTYGDVISALPPGRYTIAEVTKRVHESLSGSKVDPRTIASVLSRYGGRYCQGKQLTTIRTKECRLYVVTAAAVAASNAELAQVDAARRDGIATGAVAGLLRSMHGIGMTSGQGTALVLLNALSEMGFTWRNRAV